MKYSALLSIIGISFLPIAALAAGLVPCGGPGEAMCTTRDFVYLANNIINILISGLSIIAVIVMVYSGFEMVTSGGDASVMARGKKHFTNVVIGIAIVLASWLIIDTILTVLTGVGLGYWGTLSY